MQENMERWSAERYMLAEKTVLEVLTAEGATFTEPISRAGLRMLARKRIRDNGLLDNFLKQVGGKIAPAGTDQIWLYFVAGWVAGTASRTATAPLDRLKVALQVQTTPAAAIPAFSKIRREDGLLGFFRGNGLNIVKVIPETVIKFYAYEILKDVIRDIQPEKGDIGTSGRLVAGGLAGAVAQTAIYPLDLIKTRLQTCASNSGKGPKLGTLTKDIWIQEGPRAFYKGLVPSLLGIIPYAGIDLTAYETLKDLSKRYVLHDGEPGPLTQLGCGTVSGAIGATCIYPLHVIRTRLQAQPSNVSNSYKGMSDVFSITLEHEGFRGFYKGLLPNLLKVVPAASITFVVYETVKNSLLFSSR